MAVECDLIAEERVCDVARRSIFGTVVRKYVSQDLVGSLLIFLEYARKEIDRLRANFVCSLRHFFSNVAYMLIRI